MDDTTLTSLAIGSAAVAVLALALAVRQSLAQRPLRQGCGRGASSNTLKPEEQQALASDTWAETRSALPNDRHRRKDAS